MSAGAPSVFVVNPGAGSTKCALYRGREPVADEVVRHDEALLAGYPRVAGQRVLRREHVAAFLARARAQAGAPRVDAVVGRGGLLAPVASGTYAVNAAMLADAEAAPFGDHAANLGALLAHDLARAEGCPAFVVDPVSVDELTPVARYSGLPELPRRSLCHALNMKAVARRHAAAVGRPLSELRLVVAHLGTGASLSAHEGGRMVDVVNPQDEGPFSGDRAGGVPVSGLLELVSRGADPRALRKRLFGDGGLFAYLGTRDVRAVAERGAAGDREAAAVLDAMAYQVAKSVGELATVLGGRVDAILLTGGAAHCAPLVEAIRPRVDWIAPLRVYAGEDEQLALAEGALRVLAGEEPARAYPG